MTKRDYEKLKAYMQRCASDGSHDEEHVYRVLYVAMEIAEMEENVDYDVLIAACLLHDIGRAEQLADPSLCHAAVGAGKAYRFLMAEGFGEAFATHVRDCIATHRFRSDVPPVSIEAKILFDADKVDVSGTFGIARTLMYEGGQGEPLYSILPDGAVSEGKEDKEPSFFQEYHTKLKNIYSHFYTRRGEEIAYSRKSVAETFYRAMLAEARAAYAGKSLLDERLTENEGAASVEIQTVETKNGVIAVVSGGETLIWDTDSAMELIMNIKYETGAEKIAVEKTVITEDFFILSTGLAGEILQKLTNYHIKIAIWGDYSGYTSKPLHDFIYESNKGGDVFFTATEAEAIARLSGV